MLVYIGYPAAPQQQSIILFQSAKVGPVGFELPLIKTWLTIVVSVTIAKVPQRINSIVKQGEQKNDRESHRHKHFNPFSIIHHQT